MSTDPLVANASADDGSGGGGGSTGLWFLLMLLASGLPAVRGLRKDQRS